MIHTGVRCAKEYMVGDQQFRCRFEADHAAACQINAWWAVHVPDTLDVGVGAALELPLPQIRRVK